MLGEPLQPVHQALDKPFEAPTNKKKCYIDLENATTKLEIKLLNLSKSAMSVDGLFVYNISSALVLNVWTCNFLFYRIIIYLG